MKDFKFVIPITDVRTADEARNLAIAWQHWFSSVSISYKKLCHHQNYFEQLAKKFNLVNEFKENGII